MLMDISHNQLHNLDEFIYEYQRNIRYYTDNIHYYNNNINTYLTTRLSMQNNSSYINFDNRIPENRIPENRIPENRLPELIIPEFNYRPINAQENNFRSMYYNYYNNRNIDTFRNMLLYPRPETHYEDVIVTPSTDQVRRATDIFSFMPTSTETVCPITQEPIERGEEVCRIIHCGHLFKHSAIRSWFQRNVRCPVCRYDIREFIIPIQTRDLSNVSLPETFPEPQMEFDNPTLENEFDDIVRELVEENDRTSSTQNSLAGLLTRSIRSFVNNELQRIPVNAAATDLIYSFDLPLTIDASGNYRL